MYIGCYGLSIYVYVFFAFYPLFTWSIFNVLYLHYAVFRMFEHRENYSWRYQELYSYNSFFGKLIFFYVTKTKIGFEIFKEFRKRKWFWKYLNRNFQIQFGNDWKFEKILTIFQNQYSVEKLHAHINWHIKASYA